MFRCCCCCCHFFHYQLFVKPKQLHSTNNPNSRCLCVCVCWLLRFHGIFWSKSVSCSFQFHFLINIHALGLSIILFAMSSSVRVSYVACLMCHVSEKQKKNISFHILLAVGCWLFVVSIFFGVTHLNEITIFSRGTHTHTQHQIGGTLKEIYGFWIWICCSCS